MNTFKKFRNLGLIAIMSASILTACDKEDDKVEPEDPVVPPIENEEEVITDVTLIFTNTADSLDIIRASAKDPDGEGIQELQVLDSIRLDVNTTYVLTYEIFNNLDPNDPEDIGDEIATEDEEHQLFYGFTNAAFANPAGDGNIDNASDPVNYNDLDGNANPVGLSTTWTTSANILNGGLFTTRLQHQPSLKTATSGANDGDTDFELNFVLIIK